jgi:hypothetical protein
MDADGKLLTPMKPIGFHTIPLIASMPSSSNLAFTDGTDGTHSPPSSTRGWRPSSWRRAEDDGEQELETARKQLGLTPSKKKLKPTASSSGGLLGWLRRKSG